MNAYFHAPASPARADAIPATAAGHFAALAAKLSRQTGRYAAAHFAGRDGAADADATRRLRIRLRRLRSLFAAHRAILDPETRRRLNAGAKALGQRIAGARDLDALRDDTLPRAAAALSPAGAKALAAALDRASHAARRDAASPDAALGCAGFLFDLHEALATGAWRSDEETAVRRALDPVTVAARRALDRAWKPLAARSEGLASLSVEDRHAFRKDLKTLRYALDFFRRTFDAPEPAAQWRAAAKDLQDRFGALNDAAQATLLCEIATSKPAKSAAAAVVAHLEAASEADWPNAVAAWRALEAEPKFWRAA